MEIKVGQVYTFNDGETYESFLSMFKPNPYE